MTESTYNPWENDKILTSEENSEINELNAKHQYGMTYATLERVIRDHHAARKHNDLRKMAGIEYRLTDINFHSYCGLLRRGEYAEALQRVKEEKEKDRRKRNGN